ncbi:MAG: hypothetical protein ACT4O9_15990 [Blastocatellia bacterium]
MKFEVIRNLLLITAFAAGGVVFVACGSSGSVIPGSDTPTAAYKRLYSAVKSKNTESIKSNLTKKSQDFAVSVSQRNNTPIEKVFENGFTATTFAESLPEIRDERISGDMANVEVWNSKDSIWEDLPFILEDGAWKLAVGDLFAGTFKSPGKGRAAKEAEAANVMSNTMKQIEPPSNSNLGAIVGPANSNTSNSGK